MNRNDSLFSSLSFLLHHFLQSSLMLTRIFIRRLSINNSNRSSRLYRWLDIYEDFVGLKEVKQAQNAVNDV